ncbi:(-)-isopiperitenol/(-)-carveol dehydrogenase, mitochondrial-like [Pistacia vera]|uniref:(-)-isopiperitenol/(-)-carveol dehydrogenase, mitochondrial-like n=1 Tax=Pistacia vera TaxID=55513 RepID=UPI001262C901|nr:(-)-isopiperitenol/(-)-carveol dehydrogenase, mitochondrial-like [Pistacia vera]
MSGSMHTLSLPPKKLEGKVAVITGGASGIGEATAHLFADHGARMIVIADIQDDLGQQVAKSIGTEKCMYMHCDVANEDQVKALVDSTVRTYGQLDIMFSNAGILSASPQTVLDLDLTTFDRVFAVNVRGMAACVKHAARVMIEKGVRGSIVCTASVTGSRGGSRLTDYCMSKHAVIGLIRSASTQLGVHGIRVNSVSPSAVATPTLCRSFGGIDAEQAENICERFSSLKGIVPKVNHVADTVLFLASEDSAFVSGHDLVVDGGLLSKML